MHLLQILGDGTVVHESSSWRSMKHVVEIYGKSVYDWKTRCILENSGDGNAISS